MQQEPRLKPQANKTTKWALPAVLVVGSVIAVLCALGFAVYFIFFFEGPKANDAQPTPGGQVVRYNTTQAGENGDQPLPTLPPLVTNTPLPEQPAQEPTKANPETENPDNSGQEQQATEEAKPEEEEPEEKPTKKPPQPSKAADNSFAFGMQVDPAAPKQEVIDHLNSLGITWVKFQVSWKDTEPEQGVRNWGEWDQIILAYHNAGFNIMLSVPKAPDWARPSNTNFAEEGPPADPETYGSFVGEMAQRYKGGVQAIEVWNEQNLAREGGGAPMPPEQYIALLSNAYAYIKTADPSIIVVSGAPTPAGDVPGAAIDDVTYLNAMYAAGLKNVSDAVGAHPSGYNCPASGDWQSVDDPSAAFRGPFENRHHSWCFRGTMESYREVMVANGDANKLLWATEFGWAVAGTPLPGYEYASDNTRDEQAQWIAEAYQLGRDWGWVGPMFLWNLNYGVTKPGSEQAAFSILTAEGATPAYQTLVNLPK